MPDSQTPTRICNPGELQVDGCSHGSKNKSLRVAWKKFSIRSAPVTGPGFSFRHLLDAGVLCAFSMFTQGRRNTAMASPIVYPHSWDAAHQCPDGISNSGHLMGQGVNWTRQREGWVLQKSKRVSLCAVRDEGTGRSAHTSDSKWSPWWQLHCLPWLVTPNLVLSYSQIAVHMLVSFSLKVEHTSHLWISQLLLSVRKTNRREDPTGATDGQVLIAYHGWHEPVLTFPGTECQRFDRMLTEPSIDVTRQKALTRPLEISGIYVFLFLYLEGREIREPSPCGLSTGR